MEEGQQAFNIGSWLATYWSDLISIIGTVASLVGLILTYRVFNDVKSLTKQYGLKRFAPERIKSLKEFYDAVEESLLENNQRAKDRALDNLSRACVTISDLSLRFKEANPDRYDSSFSQLEKDFSDSVDKCNASKSKNDIRTANRILNSLIDACNHFYEEENWRVNV
ncbi:MAG: hypothetical protein ACPGWR_15535 [Ardenticatenaceae bacterium]